MEKIKYNQDHIILKIGAVSDFAFIILNGEVGVYLSMDYENSNAKPNFILGKNEVFGELGIINDTLRTASIKSLTDVELLKIDKNELKKMIDGSPPFIQGLIRTLSYRLSSTSSIARKK
tara:strand:+ start:252 stop:608 length:357 start_codon:yes stop_codon:yes gene_type:complete